MLLPWKIKEELEELVKKFSKYYYNQDSRSINKLLMFPLKNKKFYLFWFSQQYLLNGIFIVPQ